MRQRDFSIEARRVRFSTFRSRDVTAGIPNPKEIQVRERTTAKPVADLMP